MLSSHTLNVHAREKLGSRYAQRERAKGLLPAVVYGHGQAPRAVSLEKKQAMRYFLTGEKVFTVDIPGEPKGQTVILKDMQFDYLGTNPVHVDLARVDLDEKITAKIPIRLIGEAIGLKKAGAILTHPNMSLTVKCTVRTLLDHLDVDITNLDMDQAIHVRDIALPAGIELAEDADAIVATITAVKEEVVSAEAAAADGAAAGPEVITAKKEDPKDAAAGDKGGDKGKKEKK